MSIELRRIKLLKKKKLSKVQKITKKKVAQEEERMERPKKK